MAGFLLRGLMYHEEMENAWHSLGDFVVDRMDGSAVLVLFVGLVILGWMWVMVSNAVYAFATPENLNNRFLRSLYTQGLYGQEHMRSRVYVGGSVVALIGMTILGAVAALAFAALFLANSLGYIALGNYVAIPAIGFVTVALSTIVSAKAHLKRWGLGEHTFDASSNLPDSRQETARNADTTTLRILRGRNHFFAAISVMLILGFAVLSVIQILYR